MEKLRIFYVKQKNRFFFSYTVVEVCLYRAVVFKMIKKFYNFTTPFSRDKRQNEEKFYNIFFLCVCMSESVTASSCRNEKCVCVEPLQKIKITKVGLDGSLTCSGRLRLRLAT